MNKRLVEVIQVLFIAAKSLVEQFCEGLLTGKIAMIFNVGDQTFTSKYINLRLDVLWY